MVGGRGEAFLCSSRTTQVSCVGIERGIASPSYGNSSFGSLPDTRERPALPDNLGYSPTEAETDKDILKVSFQPRHSVSSACEILAPGSKPIS